MAFNLKTASPDTSFPAGGFLFGADSQSATDPSIYTGQTVLSAAINDMVQTWNAGATTFAAILMNVTDTASATESALIDLRVGGASRFRVRKDGQVSAGNSGAFNPDALEFRFGSGVGARLRYKANTNSSVCFGHVGAGAAQGLTLNRLSFSSNPESTSPTLFLERDDNDILALRRGTNAQTSRVYGTFTDASNGRWVELAVTTAGVATLRATGNGTGASGNVLHISSLPTSNPGPGILWNNAGTPAIGT